MKYQKYLVIAFVAALFLPLLSAKTVETSNEEFNLSSVAFIEFESNTELGFDTSKYLPENFDPYTGEVAVESLNFIEDDRIELGFDTTKYLPEDFDPYRK